MSICFNTSRLIFVFSSKIVENRALVRTRVRNRGDAFGVIKLRTTHFLHMSRLIFVGPLVFFTRLGWESFFGPLNPFLDDFLYTSQLIFVLATFLRYL